MPVHFIDNYPRYDLASCICKPDKSPLYGELWVYQELIKFNENGFLKDEDWYVKHNYNLSSHPFSENKVEGQIDFLVLTKYGILIIEVKGGAIEVENDVFYSYNTKDRSQRYPAQNPFIQVKDYVHSLRALIDSSPFVYRAVVFPHESNFKLIGPQLSAYGYLFFSKTDLDKKDSEHGRNELFFNFLTRLAKSSRRTIVEQLHNTVPREKIDGHMWEKFPLLSKREVERLKSELCPEQTTYGFDPERVMNEIVLEENYEILKGLRRNRKVMVQGGPGTGKTVLATKFLAENLIKQHKGIYYCANQLLRSKMRHLICEEYHLDPNLISFRIYHYDILSTVIEDRVDFIIVDEAQEFFDKGLDALLEQMERLERPKCLILYDPEQAIIRDFKDIDWYADFLLDSSFVHYSFGTIWRCTQDQRIAAIAHLLQRSQHARILKEYKPMFSLAENAVSRLSILTEILEDAKKEPFKCVILVESSLIDQFRKVARDYFSKHIEELTENNINLKSAKVRFSTPIKFRGLEVENVVLVTSGINDRTRIENYIAVTRAIYSFRCILWN